MSATVLLFLCVLGLSLAQCSTGRWESTFNQSSVFSTGYGAVGVNQGTFSFNWNTYKMSIVYAGDQVWAEYFEFNPTRGYNNNYTSQKLSSYGKTCDPVCGVSMLSASMPPLGIASGMTQRTKGAQVSGTNCFRYTLTNSDSAVANFTMRDNGEICSVTMKDNRVFTMTGMTCSTSSTNVPGITIPANCSCKGKADIWIMVDHSTSISDSEMNNFKTVFVQPFLNKLAITPDEINVGMSWFHLGTGLNFALTGNIANINAGMNAWITNCSRYDPRPIGCQVGATATATGLSGYNGACHAYDTQNRDIPAGTSSDRVVGATEWFVRQASRNVPRIFITLTDGAMNRYTNPYYRCNRNDCGCGNSCQGNDCTGDLQAAVNNLVSQTNSDNPGQSLTLIAVGIGSTCTDYNQCLSMTHLTTLAGGKTNNILQIGSFNADQLAQSVQDLVLLSCPAENNQANSQCIQGCCGLCVCGVCKPPTVTSCTNNNLCTKTTFNGVCCNADTDIPLPTQCNAVPANKCNITSCNANANGGLGACAWNPLDCSGAGSGCETRSCDSSTGSCSIPNRDLCPPIPCTYGPWSQWGNCPVTCGGSTQTRTRNVNRTAADGGADCDPTAANETQPCGTACCPVACSWNQWQPWGACTQTCGSGTRTATRTSVAAVCGGAPCSGTTSKSEACNTQCCPVDCAWTTWAAWGTCSKTCGTGTQSRTRTQIVDDCPGAACGGADSQNQNCNTQNCPINCLGEWSAYESTCPCNPVDPANATSLKYRYFTITRQAQFGGTPCVAADGSNESQVCQANTSACVPVNCSGRSVWTNCTCANPTRSRTFIIDVRASGPNATECNETAGLKETFNCNCTDGSGDVCTTYCPVNCEGYYTEWSNCSCVTNKQNRTYIITKPANHSGLDCPAANNSMSEQDCVPICPVPCVGAFVTGPCLCDTKNKTRRFDVTTPARDGGAPCEHEDGYTEQLVCADAELSFCPTPCEGAWTEWSTCDCDYFNQTRTYQVTKPATNGGAACPTDDGTVDNRVCTPSPCEPANPFCETPSDCNDGNLCTEDKCVLQPRGVYRCDWSTAVVCNDSSGCTADTCDPLVGCVYTETVFCNDNSVCTNESCHPTKGCQYTNKICPQKDICFLGTCHPVQGCGIAARNCNTTNNCSEAKCDVNYTKNGRSDPCYELYICPFDFGLIAGISAGAAVAIAVCAALVALAVLGGGSYALASQMAQDDDTIITKNPMFQAKGTSGTNPLNVE